MDTVDIYFDRVLVVTETSAKLLIAGQRVWLPVSECPELAHLDVGDGPGEIPVPEWLAIDRNLV